jgi:F-type H+-transporting ATPase subunit b
LNAVELDAGAGGVASPVIIVAQAEGVSAGIEAGELHAAEDEVFPPFDPTFFASQLLWLAITFTALYLVLARVVIPRLGGILEDRRDRIANDLDQAERLKEQSNEAIAAYERALAKARADAFAVGEQAREAAKRAAAAKQAEIEAALNARLAEAEARIGAIKQKALADVGAVATEVAGAVVERLLGVKPTANEISGAVAVVSREAADNA